MKNLSIHNEVYNDKIKNKYRFNLSQTSKVFFINNPKVASRYICEVVGENTTRFWLNLPDTKLHWYENSDLIKDSKYVDEIRTDWDNIVNNRNKKDIVILYRDPLKRFVSAVVQDTLGMMGNHESRTLLYPTLNAHGFTDGDVDMLCQWRQSAHPSDYEFVKKYSMSTDKSSIPLMMKHLYKIHLNNLLKRSDPESSHASSHCIPLLYLLNSINIDTNKLKFIDIDETPDELGNYLKSIEMNIPINKHSNSILGPDLVYDILLNDGDFRLRNLLSAEYVAYNILKTYHT